MSLQIWLPLISDIHNQGLDNIDFSTVSGTASFAEGKLGTCLTSGDIRAIDLNLVNKITTDNRYSWTCWINLQATSSCWLLTLGNGNGTTRGLYKGSNDVLVWAYWGAITNFALPYVMVRNTWVHLAVTSDGSLVKYYLNGEYQSSLTATNTNALTNGYITIYGNSAYFNDVRLYDEVLSPMQIKLISQGLICHYPLNKNSSGQENLLRNSYRADGNDAQQKYGWEKNNRETPEIVEKDGFQCIHLQTSCTEKKIPSIKSANKILLENGMEYTISCDLMIDKEIKVGSNTPIHYHNGSSSTINEFNFSNANNGKGFTFKSISPVANTIIPANTWQHYEQHIVTVATPSDSSLPYSTYRAFIYGSVRTVSETATVNMWLKNWKIEKGAIPTSWCPNSLDDMSINLGYNENIEYDVSGYCNNGAIYNIIDYSTDTPKYSLSTVFNGTNSYINIGKGGKVKDAITVSSWVYMNDWSTYSNPFISCTQTGGWNFSKNGSNLRFLLGTGATSNTNKNAQVLLSSLTSGWHMITATYDGLVVSLYIDGILTHGNTIYSTKTPIYYNATNDIIIGAEAGSGATPTGEYFNGRISDVRIYATALSDTDILALYKNSAYIDSFGKTYTSEYTNASDSKVDKKGVWKTDSFQEFEDNTLSIVRQGNDFLSCREIIEY